MSINKNPAIFGMFNKDFDKYLIGFDNQWNRLSHMHEDITRNVSGYPPYNIKKVDDTNYEIQMAVSGFSEPDINITFEDGKLKVVGEVTETESGDDSNFIYRGIASRNFSRAFALNDQIEIRGAELNNGMLKIKLESVIPDHKKPRKIAINGPTTNQQLLTE